MGSQWSGMGRSMMEINMFRDSIMKSDAVLKQHGVNLYDMIMNEEELANDVVKSFVGITSIQVGDYGLTVLNNTIFYQYSM